MKFNDSSGSAPHLNGLDGLRGLAALMVFVYHARWRAGDSALQLGSLNFAPLLRAMDSGVGIFFVLSGLLLSLPFWEAILSGNPVPDWRCYVWRRALRILPAYYAVLVVVYLLNAGTYTFYGMLNFLLHVCCLQTFVEYTYCSGLNPVLWSIGVEWQFYLLLPLLMGLAGVVYKKWGLWSALTSLVLAVVLLDRGAFFSVHQLQGLLPVRFLAAESRLDQETVLGYLKWFAWGFLAAPLVVKYKGRFGSGVGPDLICVIAVAAFVFFMTRAGEAGWRTTKPDGWLMQGAMLSVLIVVLPFTKYSSAFLESRPVSWLGRHSYGVYLWHHPVQVAVFGGTLPGRLSPAATLVVCGVISLAITLLLAAASYRFIEQPALALKYRVPRWLGTGKKND